MNGWNNDTTMVVHASEISIIINVNFKFVHIGNFNVKTHFVFEFCIESNKSHIYGFLDP